MDLRLGKYVTYATYRNVASLNNALIITVYVGITKIRTMRICNPTNPKICEAFDNVLVDSGTFYTFIPRKILLKLGIKPLGRERMTLANGKKITRQVGTAVCDALGKKRGCEVAFGSPKDAILLGADALEGLGAELDPKHRRIIMRETFPAF